MHIPQIDSARRLRKDPVADFGVWPGEYRTRSEEMQMRQTQKPIRLVSTDKDAKTQRCEFWEA
jgi:hypothetical protein